MLSNFELLSLIRNAIPIEPQAKSGRLAICLGERVRRDIFLLKNGGFLLMIVGSYWLL